VEVLKIGAATFAAEGVFVVARGGRFDFDYVGSPIRKLADSNGAGAYAGQIENSDGR